MFIDGIELPKAPVIGEMQIDKGRREFKIVVWVDVTGYAPKEASNRHRATIQGRWQDQGSARDAMPFFQVVVFDMKIHNKLGGPDTMINWKLPD